MEGMWCVDLHPLDVDGCCEIPLSFTTAMAPSPQGVLSRWTIVGKISAVSNSTIKSRRRKFFLCIFYIGFRCVYTMKKLASCSLSSCSNMCRPFRPLRRYHISFCYNHFLSQVSFYCRVDQYDHCYKST